MIVVLLADALLFVFSLSVRHEFDEMGFVNCERRVMITIRALKTNYKCDCVEIQRHNLQRESELNAGGLLLDFFRDVNQKVESYIETLEVMQNRELMSSISRGLRGKGIRLEEFMKKKGFA